MAGLEIRIKQNAAFADQLAKLANFTTRTAKEQIVNESFPQFISQVISQLQEYPPETAANRPPPPYYIRGQGKQITLATNLNNSQNLGAKWSSKINFIGNGRARATIENSATYASYVHLKETQAWFHALRYWPTAEDIIAKAKPQLEYDLSITITNYLKE